MTQDLAQPLFPPPSGYVWELQRDVAIYTGSGENNVNIALAGGNTYDYGANYGLAGAATYELGRWIYAQIQMYVNHVATELVAVEPDADGASPYVNAVGAQRFYSSPPALWPETFEVTFINTRLPPTDVTSLGAELLMWVGDVWAAVPITSRLGVLNPNSPLLSAQSAGLQLTWPRRNSRVDLTRHTLGQIGGLTWPRMWDGEKRFLLDGLHLVVDALPNGGHSTLVEYRFTKIPNSSDPGVAGPGGANRPYAQVDITNTDDADYVTA